MSEQSSSSTAPFPPTSSTPSTAPTVVVAVEEGNGGGGGGDGPHVLDLRSLALFRIFLGLYLLYDLYDRVFGFNTRHRRDLHLHLESRHDDSGGRTWSSAARYNLAWYTSTSNDDYDDVASGTPSFLAADDTPHRAPIHQLWFYRGSQQFQLATFALTALLALLFTAGAFMRGKNNKIGGFLLKVALFLSVTAIQNRNMHVHDGSDTFVRHLLFWCCFLPVANASWKKTASIKTTAPKTAATTTTTPASDDNVAYGLPCLALTLQIALMYWGTVAHRTTDLYAFRELHRSEWLPPQLRAVHYALSGDFAARSNMMAHLVRTTPFVSKSMTAMAMIGETVVPALCLVDSHRRRHWYALLLFLLHFGLLLTVNLPNWQLVGMLTQVVWVPTHAWDRWLALAASPSGTDEQQADAVHKKTDGDDTTVAEKYNKLSRQQSRRRFLPSNPLAAAFTSFWFAYMLYNWVGCRGIVRKLDNGDIGEGARLSQYWVMYASVSHTAHPLQLTGIIQPKLENDASNSDKGPPPPPSRRLDLLRYLQRGQWREQDGVDFVPEDMTRRYPSPRWERALAQWSSRSDRTRGERFCKALCRLVNDDLATNSASGGEQRGRGVRRLDAIELRYKHVRILPPASARRYDATKPAMPDTVVTVACPN